jgi:hypothetical protein
MKKIFQENLSKTKKSFFFSRFSKEFSSQIFFSKSKVIFMEFFELLDYF